MTRLLFAPDRFVLWCMCLCLTFPAWVQADDAQASNPLKELADSAQKDAKQFADDAKNKLKEHGKALQKEIIAALPLDKILKDGPGKIIDNTQRYLFGKEGKLLGATVLGLVKSQFKAFTGDMAGAFKTMIKSQVKKVAEQLTNFFIGIILPKLGLPGWLGFFLEKILRQILSHAVSALEKWIDNL